MNIHPLFVHFPIALLSLYSIFETIRISRLKSNQTWFAVKAVLVIIGVLSGLWTLFTGSLIEHEFRKLGLGPTIRIHSAFADLSILLYAILAVVYSVLWLSQWAWFRERVAIPYQKAWGLLRMVADYVYKTPIAPIISIAGLIALMITGALGASMVYGPNVDPFVALVSKLLLRQ